MRQAVLQGILVLALGALVGVAASIARPGELALSSDARVLEVGHGITLIGLAEARKAFDAGGVMVDARAEATFERGHISGAVPLTVENYEKDYRTWWEFIPNDGRVVVYASAGEAPIAAARARWLVKLGHKDTVVFYDGWEAWQAAGYPHAEGKEDAGAAEGGDAG